MIKVSCGAALLLGASLFLSAIAWAQAPAKGARLVCVGDSITDGNTYPQIILQALVEAKKPVPTVICSGVVCDTMPTIQARLDKTILVHRPKLITLTAGTNDALRGVTAAAYETSLRDIVTRVRAAGSALILMTPCIINLDDTNKPNEGAEAMVAKYIEVQRKVAQEFGLPVAENNARQRAARDGGQWIMSPDGIHPNYLGQALMARAILDAMGYQDVPLPKTFHPKVYTGAVLEWRMRLSPVDEKTKKTAPLTEETVAALKVDDTWQRYTLPDAPLLDAKTGQPVGAEDWNQQLRANGFATRVQELIGKGPALAVAQVKRKKAGTAYLNVGGDLSALWVNGKKIPLPELNDAGQPCLIGFHAGKLRLPVELKKGANTLVVENPGQFFFLSVTDTAVWEDEYCKQYK